MQFFNGCNYYLTFLNEIQGYVAFFNICSIIQEQTRTCYKIFVVSLSSCICSDTASNFSRGATNITHFLTEIQGYVASFNFFYHPGANKNMPQNFFSLSIKLNLQSYCKQFFNGCNYYLTFLNEIQGYVTSFNIFSIIQEQTRTCYKIFVVSLSSCICSDTASNFLKAATRITYF